MNAGTILFCCKLAVLRDITLFLESFENRTVSILNYSLVTWLSGPSKYLSGIKMPFKLWTEKLQISHKYGSFGKRTCLFEYWTSPVFEWLLYCTVPMGYFIFTLISGFWLTFEVNINQLIKTWKVCFVCWTNFKLKNSRTWKIWCQYECNRLDFCLNGTTSMPKSVLRHVVDKVRLFVSIWGFLSLAGLKK